MTAAWIVAIIVLGAIGVVLLLVCLFLTFADIERSERRPRDD